MIRIRVLPLLLALAAVSACGPATAPPPAPAPGKPIVSLTFDDGDADNFMMGALLQENGLRATFYIPSGLVGRPGFMSWEQLQSLQAAGNEIGGHSVDHIRLSGLEAGKLRYEICDDRQNLVSHGFQPVSFAYPFGNYDPNAVQMVKDCGYAGARTVHDGPQPLPLTDRYTVRAFPYVVSDTSLPKLQRYVNGTRQEGGGWVVLVFHHVCDGCDYFAVRPGVMKEFVPWLAEQQKAGRLEVRTFAEMVTEP